MQNGAMDGAALNPRLSQSPMDTRSAADWEVMIEYVMRFQGVC